MAREGDTQKNQNLNLRALKHIIAFTYIIYIREKASSPQKMTLLNASKEIFGAKHFLYLYYVQTMSVLYVLMRVLILVLIISFFVCCALRNTAAVIDLFHPSPLNNTLLSNNILYEE